MIAPNSEAAAPTFTNPGDTLRAARESKGWSISAVGQQLNLSERSLLQIEAGDFSKMPGHTFARGYVRAYAKLLGLDQAQLVQQFDHHTGTDATGSSVNSLGHIDQPVRLSRSMIRFFTFLLTLVIAAAAFFWWQDQSTRSQSGPAVSALERIEVEAADGTTEIHLLDRSEEPVDATDPAERLALDSGEEPVVDIPSDSASVEPLSSEAPEQVPEAPGNGPAGSPEPSTTSEPLAPAVSADIPPVAPGEGRLTLNFTADCWTRVTDASGQVLYSGLAKAGTSRTVVGKTPLDLHLGFASGVQVDFNGEAVSLSGKTRGETARLKIGQ